jgi:hypothetical protein
VRELLAGRTPPKPTCAEVGAALRLHVQLAREHFGRAALAAVRSHAIKYAQYHPQPEAARARMVAVRSDVQLDAAVDELFADAHDGGVPRELRPADAVRPGAAAAAECGGCQ